MRIAIISDIHGNLEALKTTLEDIKKREVDEIICLGDIIAKGVHPKECVKLIKENCQIVLAGNCDKIFSKEYENIYEVSEIEKKRIEWNQSMLSEDDRDYLSNLPFSYEFYMSGSLVRLFHATPEVINKTVINLDSIETKLSMFEPSNKTKSKKQADVIIYGHIHHQYMDKLYNKTLINAGSVGNSINTIRNPQKDSSNLETTKSFYIIIEGEYGSIEYNSDISYQFISVPYNIEKELEEEFLNIEKEAYRHELLQGKYRNMDKINNNFKKLGIDVDKIYPKFRREKMKQ